MKNWKDQNGNVTPINKLEYSHLRNIICYLWRVNPWLRDKMKGLGLDVDADAEPIIMYRLYLNYILYTHEFKGEKKKYEFKLNGDIAQDWNDQCEQYDSDEDPMWEGHEAMYHQSWEDTDWSDGEFHNY